MHLSCPRRSSVPSSFDFKRSFAVQQPTSKHRHRSDTNHSRNGPPCTISISIFLFFVHLFRRVTRISPVRPSPVFVHRKSSVRGPALNLCELYVSFRHTFPLSALFCALHRRRLCCSFIFFTMKTHTRTKDLYRRRSAPTITSETGVIVARAF